jgi:hypothetical protein
MPKSKRKRIDVNTRFKEKKPKNLIIDTVNTYQYGNGPSHPMMEVNSDGDIIYAPFYRQYPLILDDDDDEDIEDRTQKPVRMVEPQVYTRKNELVLPRKVMVKDHADLLTKIFPQLNYDVAMQIAEHRFGNDNRLRNNYDVEETGDDEEEKTIWPSFSTNESNHQNHTHQRQ